jgi:hypothetical protein
MLIEIFANRGEECLKLAQLAGSRRDRDFFVEMARAWYGLDDNEQLTEPPERSSH